MHIAWDPRYLHGNLGVCTVRSAGRSDSVRSVGRVLFLVFVFVFMFIPRKLHVFSKKVPFVQHEHKNVHLSSFYVRVQVRTARTLCSSL